MRAPPAIVDLKAAVGSMLFGAVVNLMRQSELHRRYTIADLDRLLVPPLALGQHLAFQRNGELVGWASWAMFGDFAQRAFEQETRPIVAADWKSGPYLWLVDVIGHPDDGRALARMLRSHLTAKAAAENWPVREARWLRRKPDGTVRRMGRLGRVA